MRVGGVVGLKRSLMLADGSIKNSSEGHPHFNGSVGEFFVMLKERYPKVYQSWLRRSQRIQRMYKFFKGRIPHVVNCVLDYPIG